MTTKPVFPHTLNEALDPHWLTHALTPLTGGARVSEVDTVEVLKTVATKVRFTIRHEAADEKIPLCLKALLDVDEMSKRGGPTTVLEAEFYEQLAPRLDVRCPDLAATVIDREQQFGVVIMHDVIAQGGKFNSALEPFTVEMAKETLEQLAHLHVGRQLVAETPWVKAKLPEFARNQYVPEARLQELMNGARGEALPARTRDAKLLLQALKNLAEYDAGLPQYLIHADCHAGNSYRTKDGAGLIDWQVLQSGGWALDIAYHIAAVLPVELAEREERNLLEYYLDSMRHLGAGVPDFEAAWQQYRTSVVWGYFLWAITQRVEPAITNQFFHRLGASVTRHESFRLLGL